MRTSRLLLAVSMGITIGSPVAAHAGAPRKSTPAPAGRLSSAEEVAAAALRCTTSAECVVRGIDEWEQCKHVREPPDGGVLRGAGDATSQTQDGYTCECRAAACVWVSREERACADTGGTFTRPEDCPPCPPDAVCEACRLGCSCPPETKWNDLAGCAGGEWTRLDLDGFASVEVPEGWQLRVLPCEDCYRGELVHGEVRLAFELGWYVDHSFVTTDPHRHRHSSVVAGGYPAYLVTPRAPGEGVTGILFTALPGRGEANRFVLWGKDLSGAVERTAVQIFGTMRFDAERLLHYP